MIWDTYRQDLEKYCFELATKYNGTLCGYCRIKYNSLYPILHDNLLSDDKKGELWESFRTSLNSDPITEITDDKIVFNKV